MFAILDKAKHDRKYERPKLGDGQACYRSSDYNCVANWTNLDSVIVLYEHGLKDT
jgi:hypothetical protein